MKRIILFLLIGLAAVQQASAYNTITVQDSIPGNTHWTNDQQYLLKGYVYVTAGATLTIDSGTIIKGDKNTKGTLIIERGAKVFANGTREYPVVFTSNQPAGQRSYGDWGGVIICGNAPTNWNTQNQQVEGGPRSLYGGVNPADNSGKLSFVRIEFPGIAFSPNNEINGLTLCGVGNGTQLDHIQVSYSGDDAIEWFGGNVNAKYLVAYRTWDDDFDNDNGYSGKNQFLASMRDPNTADQSGSKGFESDSYLGGTYSGIPLDSTKINRSVFSNVTLVGPMLSTTASIDNQYIAGVHIRRGSAMSLLNSIIIGYPTGVLIDESSSAYGSTTANIANGIMQFRNNIIAGIPTQIPATATGGGKEIIYVKDGARNLTVTTTNADTVTGSPFAPFAGPYSWLMNPAYSNRIYASQSNGVRLTNAFSPTNPNLIPLSTSPVVYNTKGNGSATAGSFNPNNPINYDTSGNYANYNVPLAPPDFTTSKASDVFFTKVNYVGAFAGTGTTSDNWMATWANFDPVNTDYSASSHTGPVYTTVANAAVNFSGTFVYPNPARQSATVVFQINANSQLKVVMTDMTGKTVKTVFNGSMSIGQQALNIDLSSVTAGMYFISISSANNQKTVKLSVIK